jgi:DNA repair exonuclease SbcCD ATPase subunit
VVEVVVEVGVEVVMIDLEQEQREVAAIESRLLLLAGSIERENAAVIDAQAAHANAQEAQDVLQHLSQAVQQQVHSRIANIVSSCLTSVFDDPYTFKINFDRKRGRTEACFKFLRNGLEVNPLTSCGGGVVDVAAFALRVICLVLHRPRLSRILILDEPFRFVSAHYREKVRAMLEQLAKDMKCQFIFVTHEESYRCGKEVQL